MIGNDIVDLSLAAHNSRWNSNRFIDKVFVSTEKKLLLEANDQYQCTWLLWSMKEAAYKAHQRIFARAPRLNWRSHRCFILKWTDDRVAGMVEVEGSSYFTTSTLDSDKIHTVAVTAQELLIEQKITTSALPALKEELLSRIGEYVQLPRHLLTCRKDGNGIPVVTYSNRVIFSSFSFSDHGNFSAFSLSLMNS